MRGVRFTYSRLERVDFTGADLYAVVFSGAILNAVTFVGARIEYASFNGCVAAGFTREDLYSTASYQARRLSGVSLSSNDLTGWNFANQSLRDASFSYSTLTGADFTDAVIEDADFYNSTASGLTKEQLFSTSSYRQKNLGSIVFGASDLSGVDLSGFRLDDAGFSSTNLESANLQGAYLVFAGFQNTNLRNANLSGAYLGWTYFESTNLTATNLRGAQLPGARLRSATLVESNLSDANLSEAELRSANLARAQLARADLSLADLRSTDLTHANLAGANFDGARFFGADLSFADLRRAQGRWRDNPRLLRNTILADGLVNGLELSAGERFVARNLDMPIRIQTLLRLSAGAVVELALSDQPWGSTLVVAPGTTIDLGGELRLSFSPESSIASVGTTFDLFDWAGLIDATKQFATVSLPLGTQWDLSRLYTTGEVTLIAVPEPSGLVPSILGSIMVFCWASRSFAASRWRNRQAGTTQ
jgi:uncharacterized protein YjbI with pentapeptide repeats